MPRFYCFPVSFSVFKAGGQVQYKYEIVADYWECSPVIRTNPVTGWKSLFGAGHQVRAGWIDNVTETESKLIKACCKSNNPLSLFIFRLCFESDIIFLVLKLIAENHDLQVRFRWNKHDLAIWDK